jgi:hypothetical protein
MDLFLGESFDEHFWLDVVQDVSVTVTTESRLKKLSKCIFKII